MNFFGNNPTFDPETDIPSLDGQVYIVTGASTGIGFAITAHLLAHNAAKIITLSSREESAMESIQKLAVWGDISRLSWQHCDLRDLKQVDRLARKLLADEKRIDGLILNAGIGVTKFSLSKNNLDSHFQINMLSQLHMALVLYPTLQKTSTLTKTPSRIVFMASQMHNYAPKSIKFASEQEINKDLGQTNLYYRSKLAQILIVRELVRRLQLSNSANEKVAAGEESKVLINATHPGDYVRTPLTEQLEVSFGFFGWLMLLFLSPFMPDPMISGCRSGLFAATTNKELINNRISGQYIVPDKRVEEPSAMARDAVMGGRLWTLSMNLLRDRLGKLDYESDVFA